MSFARFLLNCFAALFWLAIAVATGQWWFAIGSFVSVAVLMLIDLPGSSSGEDEADRDGDDLLPL